MKEILIDLHEISGSRVSASPSIRLCYSSDASQVKGLPDYVVRPESTQEVSRILRLCNKSDIPVTARGAGTGLAGGAVAVRGGVLLDMSGMNRIIEINIPNLQVMVEPGVVQERLNRALLPHGFFFPPDPGSSAVCTLGGMISYNSSGMRSVKYGTTRNYILDLEVVLADGSVIHTGSEMLKSAAGYDLTRLFVGSEGTLGVVTGARVKIMPLPRARKLIVASFEDAVIAGRAVTEIFSRGITPSACEILDKITLRTLRLCDPALALPDSGDLILFEVDGTEVSTEQEASKIEEVCLPLALSTHRSSNQMEMDAVWAARRLVGAAISRLDPRKSRVYIGEDVGVPLQQIPTLIKRVQQISAKLDLPAMKYGHIGDGNLHVAFFIDVMDPDQWGRLNRAAEMIHRTALELGGTVSSEHGIGLARAEYLEDQVGSGAFAVMKAIKRALDPKGILNPGKMGL